MDTNIERSFEFSQMMTQSQILVAQAADPVPAEAAMAHVWYSSDDDAFHFVDADGNDTSSVTITFTAINAQLALADATIDINDQAVTGIGGLTLVANANVSCAAGTTAVDLSLGTGTFKTPTGTHTINGAVTLAANKGITANAGTAAFDLSLATGAMKTPTSTSNLFTFNQKQAAGATTNQIADVGTGAAIPVTASVYMPITTAGAETNTVADPTFVGQWLMLACIVHAGGDRVVTFASAINQAGNNTVTFGAVDDFLKAEAITTTAGALVWRVTANDGAALSTVP